MCSESNPQGEITPIWIIFKTAYFRPFWSWSVLLQTYFSQRSIYRQKVADLFLRMDLTTPSSLVVRPPWYSKRSGRSDFICLKEKRPLWRYSANRKAGESSWRFAAIISPRLRRQCGLGRRPTTETCLGTFSDGKSAGSWGSLCDAGCGNGFATGLSKHRGFRQPQPRRSFSALVIFCL